MKLLEIADDTLESVKRAPAALLLFYAETCPTCQVLISAMEQLADAHAGKITFARINVDGNSKSCDEFDIIGTPALMVLRDGSVRWRLYGAQTEEKLRQVLEEVSG